MTYAAIAVHGTPSRTESPENKTEGAQNPGRDEYDGGTNGGNRRADTDRPPTPE